MEHTVSQGSQAWFDLRKQMIVTASNVADAVGGGRGKPYDFLLSLFQEENDSRCDNSNIQHGHEMEPVIREAYEMLTGNRTRSSGFWTIDKCDKMDDPLIGKLGASPDAIVLDDYGGMIGLCEFKAPVHVMYNDIPKQYLIQMHAQMAVTGAQWCDFMAVCIKTKSIMLKRIYFCEQFWSFISQRLLQFCSAYQEMSAGDGKGDDRATSKINTIKQWTVSSYGFPHQSQITIADLLTNNTSDKNIFIGPSEHRLTFDLLMGSYCPSPFPDYLYHREIEKVDQLIDKDMKYKIENKSKIELKDDNSKVESKDGTSKVNLNNTQSKVEMKDVYSTLKT